MTKAKVESAAFVLLMRGVDLDKNNRGTEALVCYQEGLQLLMGILKDVRDTKEKHSIRLKVEEYMTRAEQLKASISARKDSDKYHEQIHIEDNSIGNSYQAVFGRFLDEDVESVVVEDAYIKAYHQCKNFLHFCELLVKCCPNLRKIILKTTHDKSPAQQQEWLQSIQNSLEDHNVQLIIQFMNNLHDREIRLSNGWVIKIGRGLDYFKAPKHKFSLGNFDFDLRPCHQTTVNVFHLKHVRETNASNSNSNLHNV